MTALSDDIAPSLSSEAREFTIMMASLISIVAISIDAFLPALGIVGSDLGVANPNHTQFLIGFIFLGMALGEIVCGPLSDAWGRKKLLYASITIYFLGSIVCFFAASLEIMRTGRFLQGIGVAGPYISAMSIVRDRYSGRHMARVMSLVMMIFILVPAVAPAIGQGILFIADWRAIFLLYIVYSIAIMAWLYFRLPETLPVENRIPFNWANIKHGFLEILRNRPTLCYTVCMGIVFGSLLGYLNSCQQIFQVQFGVGDMFAFYFGVLALTIGASSLLNSRLVEKLGMRYICNRAFAVMIAASAVFLALHAITDITLWMFLPYAALLFFSFGLVFGNLNALAMEPMGHIAGIASALIGSLSSLISMGLGAIIGQLYNNTLIPVTIGFIVLGALALLFMALAETGRTKA